MPKVLSTKFFQEQAAHSRVKAQIVSKFVRAWLQVVLGNQRRWGRPIEAAYIDLFAGPGSYEDGSKSTPLLILESVLANVFMRSGFRAYFNDSDPALIASLKQELAALPSFGSLITQPRYTNAAATISLIDSLQLNADTPQFFFLDQFGWSAVKPDLIRRVFQARICDCAFFLRTSRMIAAVSNPNVRAAMQDIFGLQGLSDLQEAFADRTVNKEDVLLLKLEQVLQSCGAGFFLSFPFRIHEEQSPRHHLIYLGKHERGFSIMKDIMAKASSTQEKGVPVIGFSKSLANPSLFEPDPIIDLQADLLSKFAGKRLSVGEVFSRHHVSNTRFTLPSYQEALRRLESSGQIAAEPAAINRPKRNGVISMSVSVLVSVPGKKE